VTAVTPETEDKKDWSFGDPRRKKLFNFIWLNVLSIAAMLAIFFAVLYGDFLTGAFAASWRWLSNHQVVLVLAASTPFFAALLVGRASSRKAKRKRLAEARRVADEEAAAARRAREERRARERGE
jgi:MFS family permease